MVLSMGSGTSLMTSRMLMKDSSSGRTRKRPSTIRELKALFLRRRSYFLSLIDISTNLAQQVCTLKTEWTQSTGGDYDKTIRLFLGRTVKPWAQFSMHRPVLLMVCDSNDIQLIIMARSHIIITIFVALVLSKADWWQTTGF